MYQFSQVHWIKPEHVIELFHGEHFKDRYTFDKYKGRVKHLKLIYVSAKIIINRSTKITEVQISLINKANHCNRQNQTLE